MRVLRVITFIRVIWAIRVIRDASVALITSSGGRGTLETEGV